MDCPKCGNVLQWKYLNASRCLTCDPISDTFTLKRDSETDSYSSHYATDSNGVRWVTKEFAQGAIDSSEAQYQEKVKEIGELIEQINRLSTALEPFADCCDQISSLEDDEEWAKFRLLIKDYRRAKAALENCK